MSSQELQPDDSFSPDPSCATGSTERTNIVTPYSSGLQHFERSDTGDPMLSFGRGVYRVTPTGNCYRFLLTEADPAMVLPHL